MWYDDNVAEFVPGGSCSAFSHKLVSPGLPSMYPVVSDPLTAENKLDRPVKRWKLTKVGGDSRIASSWVAEGDSEMAESFYGEECLLPDSIPDELWQTHFRQHDAELSDRKETEYLLSLYKECSGRWPVIYDRWQMHAVYGLRGKSVESLKSKFNKVVMKLLEIDLLTKKKPASNLERMQMMSQSLRYLPIFSIKYNEKNEYLRRLFLENKRQPDERALAEILRVPNMSIKKKPAPRAMAAPGTVLASASIPNLLNEISASDSNRIKLILSALGIKRDTLTKTPKISKLLAIVEKETHTLIMMRDSLQRKKQELEILKTTGASAQNHALGAPQRVKLVSAPSTPAPPTHNAHTVLMEAAAAVAAQQKRKR